MAKRNKAYIRPSTEVYQLLDPTVGVTGEHLSACIIGPQYDLYRLGHEDVAAYNYVRGNGLESADQQAIPFKFEQNPIYNYEIDQDNVAVDAVDLHALAAAAYSGNAPTGYSSSQIAGIQLDTSNYLALRLQTPSGKKQQLFAAADPGDLATDKEEIASFLCEEGTGIPYCIEEGDILEVYPTEADYEAGTPRYATVKDVLGVPVAAKIEVGTASVTGKITVGADAAYTGQENDVIVLTVTTVTGSAVTASVTDSNGLFTARDVTWTKGNAAAINLPLGVTLSVQQGYSDVAVGHIFTFACFKASASTTKFNGLLLTDCPVDLSTWDKTHDLYVVRVLKSFSGKMPKASFKYNATAKIADPLGDHATSTGKRYFVAPGMELDDDDLKLEVTQTLGKTTHTRTFDFVDGKFYLSFRVLVIAGRDDDVVEIDELDDITEKFGVIDVDNPIAYGCKTAFLAGGRRRIYGLRVQADTKEAFDAAVKKTEADRALYTFAVMSNKYECQEAVIQFNWEQSQPEVKRWRRTAIPAELTGEYEVGADSGAKATFSSDGKSAGYLMVQLKDSGEASFKHVPYAGAETSMKAGDFIVTTWGDKYQIADVLSDTTLLLAHGDGPTTPVSTATPIHLVKADTADNNSERIGLLANSFGTRRGLLCFCDHGTLIEDGVTTHIPNMYLAAEIAGLSGAVAPQASITRTEITSINSAPRMYTRYSQAELDVIASYGVLIVTQDTKDGACYIRHQLTTDMQHGKLYYEDSVTRNIDNISYALDDIVDKYVGKANVTPTALQSMKVALITRLTEFTQDSPDDLIGPSLVSWEDLTVVQNKTHKDAVDVRVKLFLPLPLNNVRVYEYGYAASVTI